MQVGKLSTSTLLARGPSWLTTTDNWIAWDSKSVLFQSAAEEQLEAISAFTSQSTTDTQDLVEPNQSGIVKIINLSTFSNLQRLVWVTTWILRFVNNLKKTPNTRRGPLSVSELDSAQKLWIADCQSVIYSKEISNLQ